MIDDQDYMEEIRVEHFIVALQSMTYSTYDSAESIAPDSDFDDEQIRKMFASHHCIYGTERKVKDKSRKPDPEYFVPSAS